MNFKKKINYTLLTLFIFIITNNCIISQTDTIPIDYSKQIGFIGNLNNDCIDDTVIVNRFKGNNWMPYMIFWGKPDTTLCDPSLPDSLLKTSTQIFFSDTNEFSGSYFLDYINQDSIYDIVLKFKWIFYDTLNNSTDSIRYLCIFGQNLLTSIDSININNIDTLQDEPFITRDLTLNYGLNNFMQYEPLIFYSYTLDPLEVNCTNNNQNPNIITTVTNKLIKQNDVKTNITLSPNPVSNYFNIIYDLFQCKIKKIDLANIYSQKVLTLIPKINNPNIGQILVDVTLIPNGYYNLIISFENCKTEYIKFLKIN